MDALLMCGGRGTRLETDCEKPLFEIGERPMVDRVIDALGESGIETTYAVVSPHAPATRQHVDLETIETPGEGYVADLGHALDHVSPPVLTVAADLPLLAPDNVDRVLDAYESGSLTACVPAECKRLLGVSLDTTLEHEQLELAPTGVNIVGENANESFWISYDVRLAVNVNRRSDSAIAEVLA